MIDRRGVLAAALALPVAASAARPWPIGVQLWSVGEELAKDFDGTLRRLAAIGLTRVEAAGWHGRSAEAFRRSVVSAGLMCDSAHVGAGELIADMTGAIGRVREVGCSYLIVPSPQPTAPFTPSANFNQDLIRAMDLDAWKRNADLLNRASLAAKQAGVTVGYHNHVAEFSTYEGQRGYDVLLEATDKAVKFELDIAWASAGGANPLQLLADHSNRFVRVHLKDLVTKPPRGSVGSDYRTVPVSKGVISWRPVLHAARKAGIAAGYLEVEPPHVRSPFDELTEGLAGVRRNLG